MNPHLFRSFFSQPLNSRTLIKLNISAALGKRYKCKKDCDDTCSKKKDDRCTCSLPDKEVDAYKPKVCVPDKPPQATCTCVLCADTKDIPEPSCKCSKKIWIPQKVDDPSQPPPFCLPKPKKIRKQVCSPYEEDYDVYEKVDILREDHSGEVECYYGRCYKNKQYLLYKKYSYNDAELLLACIRNIPQPSSLKKKCI